MHLTESSTTDLQVQLVCNVVNGENNLFDKDELVMEPGSRWRHVLGIPCNSVTFGLCVLVLY